MENTPHERLLIIDFGSQVTQLIARRLRELHIYCEIHPYQKVTDAFLAELAPKAVILSGGPDSVTREGSPRAPEPYAITADLSRNFYAVQFHPEVHHTPNGATLYENFVKLAGFAGDWTMGAYREQAIAAIRAQVGDKKVICGRLPEIRRPNRRGRLPCPRHALS